MRFDHGVCRDAKIARALLRRNSDAAAVRIERQAVISAHNGIAVPFSARQRNRAVRAPILQRNDFAAFLPVEQCAPSEHPSFTQPLINLLAESAHVPMLEEQRCSVIGDTAGLIHESEPSFALFRHTTAADAPGATLIRETCYEAILLPLDEPQTARLVRLPVPRPSQANQSARL